MCTVYSGIQSPGDLKFAIPPIVHKKAVMVTKVPVYHCNSQTFRGQKIMEDKWIEGEERKGQILGDEVITLRKSLFSSCSLKSSGFLSLQQVI